MIDGSPAARLGEAIAATGLATALRESTWLYPTVETIHIVGFALLVGSIAVVDLRLLGAGRTIGVRPLLRLALPVTLWSALLVVPTGVLLFVAHAGDLVGNGAFVVKMILLFAVATNAAMFHAGPARAESDAAAGTVPRASTRVFASISLALWVAVLVAGRLIAYV